MTMLSSFCLKRCFLSDSRELKILPNRSKTAFEENRTTVYREYVIQKFYLGFIVLGRRPEWPKATSFLGGPGACSPGKFFEINMR